MPFYCIHWELVMPAIVRPLFACRIWHDFFCSFFVPPPSPSPRLPLPLLLPPPPPSTPPPSLPLSLFLSPLPPKPAADPWASTKTWYYVFSGWYPEFLMLDIWFGCGSWDSIPAVMAEHFLHCCGNADTSLTFQEAPAIRAAWDHNQRSSSIL